MNIVNNRIEFLCNGVSYQGYAAWDDDTSIPMPGVMVIHEWWGMNDYVMGRADMLAEQGYVGFAIDMYGNGVIASTPDQAAEKMNGVLGNMDLGSLILHAAYEALINLEQVDAVRTAAIGYCFGGAMVLHMARIGLPIRAVASFHGSLNAFHTCAPGSITAKILVCHGEDDAMVTMDDVAGFKAEMALVKADYEIMIYAGAEHGFSSKEADENNRKFNLPVGYNQNADQDAWAALLSLLSRIF